MKTKTEPEKRGGEVNSSKEMESKASSYFQRKKIKFLISKYKNLGGLQLFEMEKTQI